MKASKISLKLFGTHWECPTLKKAGWVTEEFNLDPAETGFVALHLWNMGDINGPDVPENFFVDMGTEECQLESLRVAENYIKPAIAAARAIGLPIFHVEPKNIAMKYDSVHNMLEEEDINPPPVSSKPRPPEVNPGWNLARAERTHGKGYHQWDGWQKMRILSTCEAESGDQVILTGAQFDRICRSKDLKNLIYTGFATNMCILDAAAATREMLHYGYKIFLIREATLGVEYPDTFPERLMTRCALKYFQQGIGDTVGFEQYVQACKTIAEANNIRFPLL
ncbi:cysteine hydrolase family protein [candidate division KSB1 bacterium]|nr:cysteine hydrolase family protein [candidate division KSB1 bacterium]